VRSALLLFAFVLAYALVHGALLAGAHALVPEDIEVVAVQ
jgi:hypothetical protein